MATTKPTMTAEEQRWLRVTNAATRASTASRLSRPAIRKKRTQATAGMGRRGVAGAGFSQDQNADEIYRGPSLVPEPKREPVHPGAHVRFTGDPERHKRRFPVSRFGPGHTDPRTSRLTTHGGHMSRGHVGNMG